MVKSKDSFTFTVGKLDAGMAILIGDRAHLIEFPSILLPPGVTSGSIVNIAVHRNVAEENRQKEEFGRLQEEIYQTFGTKTPETPNLQLRNVTQTSVTLEWAPIEAATAKIRSLDIFKNGQRVGSVPSPLRDTYTRLSGLEVDKDYTFQLILRTTAGTYPSNILRIRTHTIHDTSGISVCFGNVEDPVMLEQAKEVLEDMKAKWSDKIQIDTTHFVCSTPNNPASSPTRSSAELGSVEYQRAVQMSIPIVQPHWLFACHKEKKMVPIANFYLGTKQSPPSFTRPQSLQLSRSHSSASPSSAAPSNHRASMPVIPTNRTDSSSPSANQEDEEKAAAIRKGIMNKDFRFPRAPPAITEEPSGEADRPSDAREEEEEEEEGKTDNNKPFEVTPPEVFTPPVVSKDEEPVTEVDDNDDDVGPTVEVDLSHSGAVWGIRWTAKDTVISISADGSIVQWDSSTGQKLSALPPHTLGLVSLSVSEAGDHALFNTIEGLTKLWNLSDGSIVGSHESFAKTSGKSRQNPVWAVSLHPNAQSYASTGSDGAVTIRSASSSDFGSGIHNMSPGKTRYGMSLAHSPDGSKIALSSETGQIYMFDLESSQLLNTSTSHAMCVRSLAWSPDSQLLVSASDDKRLIIHDVRNAGKGGGTVASLTGHSSWVLNASISPDAGLIVSGWGYNSLLTLLCSSLKTHFASSADRTIKVWDMAARTAVSTIQDTNEIWTVSWRPKISSSGPGAFVSGSDDGTIKWWRGAGMG
ncbi:hypothetical protein Clacol_010129 [Clathrus columnatus]|uniref:Uncharacterized protein n=1 Tax=Clathrus columnatus TaxID=1419009 RepID=A0AAV5ASW1_9AGAM|nr:hypothetical protein Clacol_010129 [Clathrus columnatus]